MTLESLKSVVDNAIKTTIDYIQKYPISVLSEGDFERILSSNIDKLLVSKHGSYRVYNQVTHYNDPQIKKRYRVDIVIMDSKRIIPEGKYNKGYIYDEAPSIAIELKYFRKRDRVTTIMNDLEKSNALIQNGGTKSSYLYVIALLEDNKENQVKEIRKFYTEYDKNYLCKMLLCKNT